MSKNCHIIHQWFNILPVHTFPFNNEDIPENGIYVLFEKGEESHSTRRVVRVGTHTGKNQLRSRLAQHFLKENKDRSIFRKNIGRSFLNKNNDGFISQWEIDLTTREARELHARSIDFQKLQDIEKDVTCYIQKGFSFIVFRVDDGEKRLELESKIISTLSECKECRPSPEWLGLYSPKEKIRKSGLWLVNELWKEPLSDEDMDALSKILEIKNPR